MLAAGGQSPRSLRPWPNSWRHWEERTLIRIRFTGTDLAHVRFAPRPAPVQELNATFMKLTHGDDPLLHGRWRRRVLRSLPPAVEPLADLVPGRPSSAPLFLDEFSDSLAAGLDAVRATPPAFVRTELRRVHGPYHRPAPWVRGLHRGDAGAWDVLRRAQQAAFETVLGPVWPVVQDLHQAEFTRRAVAVAEHGIGAVLAGLVPGGRLNGDTWEFPAPAGRDVTTDGRGLLLLPTFHWTAHPVVAEPPGRPVVVTYPAGDGLPLTPYGPGATEDALAGVLGRTRLEILLLLGSGEEHTTSGLARRLGVSNATVSAHTTALRGAGLLTTARAGRAVLHTRSPLGGLLVGRLDRTPPIHDGRMTAW
ncbi:transcriptional regulator [Streptomyces purpureus]|uniref:Transcriptional regulator n=1 Tax=Streptomyces purpureus TaxID=1951 RepID=A0A918LQ18_9ACTN|nr:transcriptional regulator [Streptomyces purpureus]